MEFDCGYRMAIVGESEFIAELKCIVEVKCTVEIKGIDEFQLLTYGKLSGVKIGLLVNFTVITLKDGIKRCAF